MYFRCKYTIYVAETSAQRVCGRIQSIGWFHVPAYAAKMLVGWADLSSMAARLYGSPRTGILTSSEGRKNHCSGMH